jgi:Fe-S oxidoreductase
LDIDPDLSRRLHPLFRKLDIQTYWQDENSKITKEYIKRFIDENMCYVFCDGGNKVEELNYWSKHIPVGSLISVHDWLNEVQPSDVPEGLTPYRKDYWNIMNIQTATWIKNGEPNVD